MKPITVIRYENAPAIEVTWVDEDNVIIECRVYDATQLSELKDLLGDKLQIYETMIENCLSDYTPPEPPTQEELNKQILSEIDSLERQYLMPRITREATILQLETWAMSQGYPLAQFRLVNKGYRGLKELDEKIMYLRGQLK